MLARAQARGAVGVITAVTGAITLALAGTPALADSAPASLAAAAATAPGRPGAAAGRATAVQAVRQVRFAGYTFQVPRSWPVINLARHRRACVRFDRSAAYLGTPGPDESCPAGLVGTTQSILIEPASAEPGSSSVQNPVARQITVRAPRVSITATYSTDPAEIDQIVRSAALPEPAVRLPDRSGRRPARSGPAAHGQPGRLPASGSRRRTIPLLPAGATNFRGLGFDACAIPSSSYMRAWRRHSRYRAVGVFIGGSELACAQVNLSRRWLRQQASTGWHFMPLYVGPQASFGQLGRPARQATAAADDAVTQARRLGFRRHAPLYYDMEGYLPKEAPAALRFFRAWTVRLHQLGYASGVYSSALSGIGDLARHYWCDRREMPDVVFYGRWDGHRTTADPIFRRGQWPHHRRLHQYSGNVYQSFGGDTLQVDLDYLNVDLRYPQRGAASLRYPQRSARSASGSQAGASPVRQHGRQQHGCLGL